MKKQYFVIFIILLCISAKAQIINIPDANFKSRLLASVPDTYTTYYITAADITKQDMVVDTNGNGEIEVSEAQAVYYLTVQGISGQDAPTDLTDLTGIEYFTSLVELNCADNVLTTLDVSTLTNLKDFRCDRNNIVTLNISGLSHLITFYYGGNYLPDVDASSNIGLKELGCNSNQITSIDISPFPQLTFLLCSLNLITTLDLSNNHNLSSVFCDNNLLTNLDISTFKTFVSLHCNNNPLNFLNLKCGKVFTYQNLINGNMNLTACPSLRYVCVDDYNITGLQDKIVGYGYTDCEVNSYCSFTPGGTFYTIQGSSKYDSNSDGCDVSDSNYPYLKLNCSISGTAVNLVADGTGNYNLALQAGTYTLTPVLENPNYFAVSPANIITTFPTAASPLLQNFCIVPIASHDDLEVMVLPLDNARPGFISEYKIIYKNKGTTVQSGQIKLIFMDGYMDFLQASQLLATQGNGMLTWNFQNLLPFEKKEIRLSFQLNTPGGNLPLIGGNFLGFSADITPIVNDDYDTDNHAELKQLVVNSFDPNDKTCVEGTTVTPAMVGKEVHYVIRFENTGTANAENIVVRDMIDTTKFDVSSLIPISGSHPFVTKISNTNKVEFIFESINLPFDDANNDGYAAFKIKTLPTLVLGDTFSNTASIYFDYNTPITTNTATTTIALLSNPDFAFEQYFKIYPNPAKDILNIETKKTIEVTSINIYNVLGQLVLVIPNAEQTKSVDVSGLKTGNYFLKVNSDKGTSNTKFIKI